MPERPGRDAITDISISQTVPMESTAQPGKLWIDPDEIEVVRSFLVCGVRFLVIGGRAVQFHGHIRPAKDLDLLVEFSATNWDKLLRALRPLNAAVPAFSALSVEKRYQARLDFYPSVEFLTAIEGVTFEQAWSDAVETTVDDLTVLILSRPHLIASKASSARTSDVQDVNALRAIRRS
jgi:hypothetical protein